MPVSEQHHRESLHVHSLHWVARLVRWHVKVVIVLVFVVTCRQVEVSDQPHRRTRGATDVPMSTLQATSGLRRGKSQKPSATPPPPPPPPRAPLGLTALRLCTMAAAGSSFSGAPSSVDWDAKAVLMRDSYGCPLVH